uniref:Small ribosomal subunit protein uS5 n=1 Tax=Mustela putorius furo TaxID=9669 RepID=M3XNC0_MUSPF
MMPVLHEGGLEQEVAEATQRTRPRTITNLGHLVKDMKIKSVEICLFSWPIKDFEIIAFFFLILESMPVKQTHAGQATRFKAFAVIRFYNGHVGLGVKCSKEVATTIHGAITLVKSSIIYTRRGYQRNKIGKLHTVPSKVTSCCGCARAPPTPATRGTSIVSIPVPKKLLMMASIDDCSPLARDCTATLGNFVKAASDLSKTYSYPTPGVWKETVFTKGLTDHLVKTHTSLHIRPQAPAVATH